MYVVGVIFHGVHCVLACVCVFVLWVDGLRRGWSGVRMVECVRVCICLTGLSVCGWMDWVGDSRGVCMVECVRVRVCVWVVCVCVCVCVWIGYTLPTVHFAGIRHIRKKESRRYCIGRILLI